MAVCTNSSRAAAQGHLRRGLSFLGPHCLVPRTVRRRDPAESGPTRPGWGCAAAAASGSRVGSQGGLRAIVTSATTVVDSPPAFKRSPSTRADPQNQAQPRTASAVRWGEHICRIPQVKPLFWASWLGVKAVRHVPEPSEGGEVKPQLRALLVWAFQHKQEQPTELLQNWEHWVQGRKTGQHWDMGAQGPSFRQRRW